MTLKKECEGNSIIEFFKFYLLIRTIVEVPMQNHLAHLRISSQKRSISTFIKSSLGYYLMVTLSDCQFTNFSKLKNKHLVNTKHKTKQHIFFTDPVIRRILFSQQYLIDLAQHFCKNFRASFIQQFLLI